MEYFLLKSCNKGAIGHMRTYNKQTDLLKQNLVEGEVVEYKGKVCRVSISRGGSLYNPKVTVVLIPLPQVTVTEETEIVFTP
jgi:hypothetical protein